MTSRFKDKVAILFGAGSVGPGWGNGKATAVLFARNGAHVACVDVNREAAQETVDIIQGEGGAATAFACDVTNSEAVKEVVDAVVASTAASTCSITTSAMPRWEGRSNSMRRRGDGPSTST